MKGRLKGIIGELLLDKFTGPKDPGQGSHHGGGGREREREQKERGERARNQNVLLYREQSLGERSGLGAGCARSL